MALATCNRLAGAILPSMSQMPAIPHMNDLDELPNDSGELELGAA
jgi:hypothetical protein